MDYHRIDDSYFISLVTWLPKVVVFEIVEYTYNKCIDCNYYLLQEFECACGRIRCLYHNFINNYVYGCCDCYINDYDEKNIRMYLQCIIPNCNLEAWNGFKENIYYCRNHRVNKYKIIGYNFCDTVDCWRKTNMIHKITHNSTCKIHQDQNEVYVYDYVKN